MIDLRIRNENEVDIYKDGLVIIEHVKHDGVKSLLQQYTQQALNDESIYLDVLPMNYVCDSDGQGAYVQDKESDHSVHNDELPHGTLPDFYDFMVRSETLDDEGDVYCEVENVSAEMSIKVEMLLNDIYELS